MGYSNLKSVLLAASIVFIVLFTGTSKTMAVSAKTSDFIIEKGVLKQYQGSEKEIVIPNNVKTIGEGVFKDSSIEKVTIPEGVELIGKEAFRNCNKLTEIVIPNGVQELGESAFQGCGKLYRVVLGSSTYVGMSAFEDCTSLNEVIIPSGVGVLSHYAFKDCFDLEMIDLPESIGYIGAGCFENCINLETILFPTNEFYMGSYAFSNTLWMNNYEGDNVIINHTLVKYRGYETDITIPDNITVIGDEAFADCTFITNVNIPAGVNSIGNSTFYGCTGLTEIVLPKSVTSVGSYAFYGCSNLESITMPVNVEISHNSLENTKWMTDYQDDFVILNGNLLGYQGTNARVVIPEKVTAISSGAFENNDIITEVTIPKSVTLLCSYSFNNCKNLQKVYISNKNIIIKADAFYSCGSDLKLVGIGGTAEEYAQRYYIKFVRYGINKEKVTIYLGGNDTISLKINGFDGVVQWKSEDETIAKVSKNGTVTVVKTGTTKVTATFNNSEMTCTITVKNPYISKKTITITAGQTSRLNIIGTLAKINWSSSNIAVASVNSSGVITANKAGTAKITAKFNGKTYTCVVTVK